MTFEDDIPGVYRADDIRRIEDPDIRQKEIEDAKNLPEEGAELIKEYETGKIDTEIFDDKYHMNWAKK